MVGTQSPMFDILPDARAVEKLRAQLHGELVRPQDAGYDAARRVWNGRVDKYPALIARCADQEDVIEAVRFARRQQLNVAVRSGGHSVAGQGVCDGGMVIDLSLMKGIRVDPERSIAYAEAGLTLGELIGATERYDLLTPVGVGSETGIAGLTLGGGIGWLNGALGLTCDNVRAFEVVTAEGRFLRASAQENADLYWGLRGGGGNFGIVTAFEYQLHTAGPVLAGMVAYPRTRAREVLRFYRDLTRQGPDELTVYAGMLTAPDGYSVVGMALCYYGDLTRGEEVIKPLREFGPPIVDLIRPMLYLDALSLFDTGLEARKYYVQETVVKELDDAVLEALAANAGTMTSPYSTIIVQHLHGAAARIPVAATAFPVREPCYVVLHSAGWDRGEAEKHLAWARKSGASLQPAALNEAYVNFVSDEDESRVRAAYGVNYPRLAALKNRYDPTNFFHINQNIKPEAST